MVGPGVIMVVDKVTRIRCSVCLTHRGPLEVDVIIMCNLDILVSDKSIPGKITILKNLQL